MSELYIIFVYGQSLAIDTTFGRGPREDLPLKTVAHLIIAYKKADIPKFNSYSPSELTLHEAVDGEALLVSLPISSITGGTSASNPLVIKSNTDNTLKKYRKDAVILRDSVLLYQTKISVISAAVIDLDEKIIIAYFEDEVGRRR